ncbi:MAG: filamentous hemagglutinin N-terminal domain-containing protein, partial [Comamonadaceae bacterium]
MPEPSMNHRSSSAQARRAPGALRPLAAALLCLGLGAAVAQTLPQGGVVLGGNVSIPTPTGTQMTINQLTPRGIVQWQDFSIGTGFSVNVVQPSATSVLLNRVSNGPPSLINGALSANGRVFVVNPAGVLFGAGSQVNVGGLVASALAMSTSDADFMAGTEQFSFVQGTERGLVQNAGQLTATNGGTIGLIGTDVFNSGTITAPGGSALLAAGQTVTLDFGGDGLTRVTLVAGTDGTSRSISQNGTVQADGGRIALQAAGGAATLEHSGLLQANSLAVRNGEVLLEATATSPRGPEGGGGATILVEGGTVLARGEQAGLTGGTVGILADQISISDGARIDASGSAGGGSMLISSPVAQAGDPLSGAAYVGPDATLAADALVQGRGGMVWLNAARTLRAYGSLSAR